MPKRQFLFSAVFGFRNPTQEIFSELDETKAHGLILHGAFQKSEEGRRGGHTLGGRGPTPGRAALWGGPLERPPTLPLHLYNLSVAKSLVPRATIRENILRHRHRQPHLGRF